MHPEPPAKEPALVSPVNDRDQQVLETVLARASEDLEFRQRLLSDPRPAIEEAFGVAIPADFRLKFIERDANVDALIVLPDLRQSPDDDVLSEDELEQVSGGVNTHLTWSRAVAHRRPRTQI